MLYIYNNTTPQKKEQEQKPTSVTQAQLTRACVTEEGFHAALDSQ